MKKKSLINWLCLTGVLSVVFYLLHDVIGAINYPGYNWMSQAVSDLTAADSPAFIIAHGYSSLSGLFTCVCCTLLCVLVRNEKKTLRIGVYLFTIMHFVSAIGYSLFPLSSSGFDGSFQSIIHVYVVTALVVILSIVSLVLIAVGCLKGENKHKLLGTLAIISLVLMFIGAVGSGNVQKEIFGVFERFSTYSAEIFTAVLGIYGFNVFKLEKKN